ncbi:unnamed protein product [Phyllotreta striolata]|uniref:alkaline phosphatase n=1 Tax=Phyllotreta striolata TaxID=444603 RepID=A0A9N9XUW1_PHYSR|nr:unnamed protein product [Phyllotreta striolata]
MASLVKCALILSAIIPALSYKENQTYWRQKGAEELNEALNLKQRNGVAKNVILFIGDGMGVQTIVASRIYSKGETGSLAWEKFKNMGALKTYSANKLVPDSCSTATALFCGIKANHKTSGIDASVDVNECKRSLDKKTHVDSFAVWALEAGKSTGFVTTTRVTHATPSALYAHTPNRGWECEDKMSPDAKGVCTDIAKQLINDYPGNKFNVIMGGGRQCLQSPVVDSPKDPVDTWGCRSKDGRNLINDWQNNKKKAGQTYQFLSNTEELNNTDITKDYTLGVFANGHIMYDYERNKGPKGMPSLSLMTEKAIQLLQKNKKGYALMVEGGMIDQAHHRGNARIALEEVVRFSEAIQKAVDMVDLSETLIIVTSDHDHSMQLTGYPDRRDGVMGTTKSKIDNVGFSSLLYTTGGPNNYHFSVKNGSVVREDASKQNTSDWKYSQQSAILNDEVTHSGSDVLVFAEGPMAHLFNSVHEQTHVANVIAYALKIGPYKNRDPSSGATQYHCSYVLAALMTLLIYFN